MKKQLLSKDIQELRDELSNQLRFLKKIIEDDRTKLEAYYEKWGDLFYRPENEDGGTGVPTEIIIEPLSSKLRTTIKSLLDSISLIDTKINAEKAQKEDNEASQEISIADLMEKASKKK